MPLDGGFTPQAYAAALTPKSERPPKWSWSRGLISGEWKWFTRRLLFATPFYDNAIVDVHRHLRLDIKGGATISPRGFVCDATGEGAEVTIPEYMRVGWPLTMYFGMTRLGTPTSTAEIFGGTHNNTGAAPYLAWGFSYNNPGNSTSIYLNNAGGFIFYATGWNPTVNVDYNIAIVFTAAERRFYVDGVLTATDTRSYSDPTYDSTALLALANHTGINRNTNTRFRYAYVTTHAATAEQIVQLHRDPFGPMRPGIIKVMPTFKAAAAGGGATIPIFHHHYNQMAG